VKVPGKIILIDDNAYELPLLVAALRARKWEVKVEYFSDAGKALRHFISTRDTIFLIIADLHMPAMNGMKFKTIIDKTARLRKKSIPFIFITSVPSEKEISNAFKCCIHGFFVKPVTTEGQAEMLDIIIRYWMSSLHPNKPCKGSY
jgi:PleD family two-component response regulator